MLTTLQALFYTAVLAVLWCLMTATERAFESNTD
jgi:hypothetical protein